MLGQVVDERLRDEAGAHDEHRLSRLVAVLGRGRILVAHGAIHTSLQTRRSRVSKRTKALAVFGDGARRALIRDLAAREEGTTAVLNFPSVFESAYCTTTHRSSKSGTLRGCWRKISFGGYPESLLVTFVFSS